MVRVSSPSVASTKQMPKNKADFQAKNKATKSKKPRQVVRDNPLLPSRPISVSRSLSLRLEALQLLYALTNKKNQTLIDAQLMQHKDDNQHSEIGKRLDPELICGNIRLYVTPVYCFVPNDLHH